MKNSKPFRLKKPYLAWALGCCYILTGPVNLIQVLLLEHVPNWYNPVLWWPVLKHAAPIDQTVTLLVPLAGVSLLIQRRRSWAFAIVALFCAFLQNLYCIYAGTELLYPIAVPMTANSAVLVVLYYFRYPYLDRRDRIFSGMRKRHAIDLPVQIDSHQGVVAKSISSAGCSLEFLAHQQLPALGSTLHIQVDGISIETLVRYHHKQTVGVRFVSPRRLSRSKMRRILSHVKKQDEKAS